jgi:tetratricopeptide (TPR) repeat protein
VANFAAAINSGKNDTSSYNSAIWFSLFLNAPVNGMPLEEVSVKRLMDGNGYELQTLVCYLSKQNRFLEAQEAFKKYLAKAGDDETDSTLLAFAMLAESFGLKDTAVDAYQRTIQAAKDPNDPGSCAELSRMRLQGLGASIK